VLPELMASDAERIARFDREAKMLASLNHPNIAQIYGLEQTAGTTARLSGYLLSQSRTLTGGQGDE